MKMKWYDGIALAVVYIAFVGVLILTAFIGRAIIFPQHAEAFYTSSLNKEWASWGSSQNGYTFSSSTLTHIDLSLVKSTTAYCSSCVYAKYGNLSDTYTNLGITDIYIDYTLSVSSGTCTAQYAYRESATVVFTTTMLTATTTTASTTVLNISSNGYGSYDVFGASLRAGTGSYTVNCHLSITRIYDQAGNDYLEFFDSNSGGGGGTNIINITDNGMTTSEWTCETTGDDTICTATATSSVRQYDGPTYYEWLLVAGIILFILFYMLWPRLSILKFRKE